MWRDLGFREFDTVYLVQPLQDSVIGRLHGAAIAVLRRERIDARRTVEHAPQLLAEAASDTQLIDAARAGRVPFRIAAAGDRVAIHLPHELADGVEGTRLVASLLRAATGEPLDAPEPELRFPLLRALWAGGVSALRAYLAGRPHRRALPDPGIAAERTRGAFSRITLDAASVAELRRTKSPGGRATVMSRAASVALAALGAVAPESIDVRVVLPTDLRALLGGRRVSGNFVSVEAYGTLRGTDWAPAAINGMLAARRPTGAVALLAAIVRRFSHPGPKGTTGRPTVSVSLMGAIDLPGPVLDGAPVLACATVGATAGTFVFVAQVGEALTISLWDDSGAFDVAAFPEAFTREMHRRGR